MRIGVDATCWANARGYGRFARELMRVMAPMALSDEFLCFGDRRAFDAWPHRFPNVRCIEVEQHVSPTVAAGADGNRSPADMLRLTRAVRRERPDVFFSPSVYTYFPLPLGLRAVVTVHDTIAERFPHLTLPTARARLFWKLKVGLALKQARLVLTVSEYSARSISDVLGVPRARIRVAVEAPSPAYQPSAEQEVRDAMRRVSLPPDARYFVYVGGFNPHKRLDVIVDAHARVARECEARPPHLLLVGTTTEDVFHGDRARLREQIRELGTESLVHWPGFIPDAELRPLLGGAVASLLASECEGFGLPAIEAAACGTPVIATVESPLPELLEGGGFFVRPGDVDELARAMAALLGDMALRERMGTAARQRTLQLTWEGCAAAALGAIREAAA